ncbi:hemolysin family protein [Dermacoccaceae bacterium W4C1]
MTEALLLLLALLLIVACGFFVAAEFALVTVDRRAVDRAVEAGDSGAEGVRSALTSLSTQLSGAQVGITITNLAIGFLAEPAMAGLLRGPLEAIGISGGAAQAVGVALGMIISTVLTMVFGELVPKNLAIALPLQTAKYVQRFQRGFTTVAGPLISALNGMANWILHRMGIEPTEELASARSPQELSSMVVHSSQEGTLDLGTATLVRRSLLFGELHADEVMTPRSRVDFLPPDETLDRTVQRIQETGHARFPVLDPRTDDVLGLVTTTHVLAVPFAERSQRTVADVMVEPTMVPSSVDLDALLATLRDGANQLAIVIDEFGGVDGVVTLEDLVEEITGELDDEHDLPSAPRELEAGTWELSGLLRIDEVRENIGLMLPESEEYDTLAGLLLAELGRMASEADEISLIGQDTEHRDRPVTLSVVDLDGVRIDTVRVVVAAPEVHDDNDDDVEAGEN